MSRCIINDETWDHVWICEKNKDKEWEFWLHVLELKCDKESMFYKALTEIVKRTSVILMNVSILRELTRGMIK